MLQINLELHLLTGDNARITADNLSELHNAIGYFQSIGALARDAQQPGTGPAAEQEADRVDLTGKTLVVDDVVLSGRNPAAGENPSGPKTSEGSTPEKPKRGRKPAGGAAPAAAAEQTAETQNAASEQTTAGKGTSSPSVTLDDVTAAVTNLANATSLAVAREVLNQFGVKRSSELKPEQYAAFVAACRARGEAESSSDDGVL